MFIMQQKLSISDKRCSFELSIHQKILKNVFLLILGENMLNEFKNEFKC